MSSIRNRVFIFIMFFANYFCFQIFVLNLANATEAEREVRSKIKAIVKDNIDPNRTKNLDLKNFIESSNVDWNNIRDADFDKVGRAFMINSDGELKLKADKSWEEKLVYMKLFRLLGGVLKSVQTFTSGNLNCTTTTSTSSTQTSATSKTQTSATSSDCVADWEGIKEHVKKVREGQWQGIFHEENYQHQKAGKSQQQGVYQGNNPGKALMCSMTNNSTVPRKKALRGDLSIDDLKRKNVFEYFKRAFYPKDKGGIGNILQAIGTRPGSGENDVMLNIMIEDNLLMRYYGTLLYDPEGKNLRDTFAGRVLGPR